jgi:hypothetical protein
MARFLVTTCTLLALAACFAGASQAAPALLAPFLLVGATEVRVAARSWSDWEITYRAPDARWPTALARRLEQERWHSLDQGGYGGLSRSFSRGEAHDWGGLWEWTFLSVDPSRPEVVQIRVRRWLALPWWRHGAAAQTQ